MASKGAQHSIVEEEASQVWFNARKENIQKIGKIQGHSGYAVV